MRKSRQESIAPRCMNGLPDFAATPKIIEDERLPSGLCRARSNFGPLKSIYELYRLLQKAETFDEPIHLRLGSKLIQAPQEMAITRCRRKLILSMTVQFEDRREDRHYFLLVLSQ